MLNSRLLHPSLGCDPKPDDSHDSALVPSIDSKMINNEPLAIKDLNRMTQLAYTPITDIALNISTKEPCCGDLMVLDTGIGERVSVLLESLPEKEGALIPLLQRVQADQGYISPEAAKAVAEELGISESVVYGVATFYAEFKLARPGKHHLKVCLGTSCYLRGGRNLLDHLSRKLGIRSGRTTEDGLFSLETVACLGCCSRSPAMTVDDIVYGGVSSDQIDSILESLD